MSFNNKIAVYLCSSLMFCSANLVMAEPNLKQAARENGNVAAKLDTRLQTLIEKGEGLIKADSAELAQSRSSSRCCHWRAGGIVFAQRQWLESVFS
jgi:hypothetical protein